jgi:hypothetical protein
MLAMRGRLVLSSLCVAVAAGMASPSALADKRVALVIGISAYQHVQKLGNPVRDAEAIGQLFEKAGFKTVTRRNLAGDELRRVVREFSNATRDADIAVVYFAGHGIEVGGTNYLIPADAKLESDVDVEDETVPLERVLRVMEPAKHLKLVILDACRDNPFAASMKRTLGTRSIARGLTQVDPSSSNMLIAYAAKAGSTADDGSGQHSPYSTALLKHLAEPGLDVRFALARIHDDVLKGTGNRQEPFYYGALGADVISIVPAPPAPPPRNLDAELQRDYELALRFGTREAWDAFLEVHPTGYLAVLARQQRDKLIAAAEQTRREAATAPELPAPPAPRTGQDQAPQPSPATPVRPPSGGGDTTEVAAVTAPRPPDDRPPMPAGADLGQIARALQAELKRVGCDPGSPEGEWSAGSRQALERFNKHAGTRLDASLASIDALEVLRGRTSRACPPECARGYRADGERCVPVDCGAGYIPGHGGTCKKQKRLPKEAAPRHRPPAARTAAGPSPGRKCFTFKNKQFCE